MQKLTQYFQSVPDTYRNKMNKAREIIGISFREIKFHTRFTFTFSSLLLLLLLSSNNTTLNLSFEWYEMIMFALYFSILTRSMITTYSYINADSGNLLTSLVDFLKKNHAKIYKFYKFCINTLIEFRIHIVCAFTVTGMFLTYIISDLGTFTLDSYDWYGALSIMLLLSTFIKLGNICFQYTKMNEKGLSYKDTWTDCFI